jgi:uncharacterized protein YnzC (UPF0291/DUF896 family)
MGEQLSEAQKTNILLHEKMHIEQRHSIDLIFFEIIRIPFWFNPLVYMFQNRLILLQEFTADAGAAAQSGKRAYYEELLAHVFNTESVSFINTFFNHSLIKKRILMLQKSKSRKIFQLKYLVLVPVIAVMLMYTACSGQNSEKEANSTKNADTEVMDKINELAEAIMKKGELTDDELAALKFLSQEYKEGDKVYTSVGEYLEEQKAMAGLDHIDDSNTEVNLSMAELDKVPVFPGCEGSNEELKKCMIQGIATFVGNEFNTKTSNKDIKGRQKIKVEFTINKLGKVANVRATAPFPELETEAKRVVSLLPQMLPGEQDGKKVGVQYTLPIIFEID